VRREENGHGERREEVKRGEERRGEGVRTGKKWWVERKKLCG
jgi:hypothetical protein